MKKSILLLFVGMFLMLVFLEGVSATDYYVSSSGSASWSECTNINTPCSISTANANAQAGDTVNIRGGTYLVDTFINPTNSGTSWDNQIIFQAYTGETPTITGNVVAIYISGKDYIKVDGITATSVSRFFLIIQGSDRNEVTGCTFDTASDWATAFIGAWSSTESNYNWIHGNTITLAGGLSGCSDHATNFRIGYDGSDHSNHNLVEDNIISYGGHDLVDFGGQYNVFRNNILHNEGWMVDPGGCTNSPDSGYFGNRCFMTQDYNLAQAGPFLIEGNRLGHADVPPDDDGAFGLSLDSKEGIVRYNYIFNSGAAGVYFKSGSVDDNRVYSNTIYYSAHGDLDIQSIYKGAFAQAVNGAAGNVVINNLLYGTNLIYGKDYQDGGVPSRYADDTFTNNYLSTDSDPLFVNTNMDDKTSLTLPDLSLQSGSGAIDAGTHLTNVAVADTGTGTSLIVADASYFQDSSWAPSGKIESDWIAVGSVSNIVQISSIDYGTNTITLSNSISRNDGDSIWLYKDSSGRIVLYGSAPDIGAYEYISGEPQTCTGSCMDNPCDTYTDCTSLTGTCTTGYCCSGTCTTLSTCTSGADADFSGDVSIEELMNYIGDWKSGSVAIENLMTAIGEWKNGC